MSANDNILSQLRAELAAGLKDKVKLNIITPAGPGTEITVPVINGVPTKFAAPAVLVGPGVPYIEAHFEGQTRGERRYNLAATAIAHAGINDVAAEQVDALIIALVDAIEELPNWWIADDAVGQPGTTSINNQTHLGCTVTATTIRRG